MHAGEFWSASSSSITSRIFKSFSLLIGAITSLVAEHFTSCGTISPKSRTLAVAPEALGTGVGHLLVTRLEERARELELQRLFCLTFEVDFFASHGFAPIDGTPVGIDVYEHMLASHDDGVAEFLDLARMKPNTLGNTRMLKELD